FLIRGSIVVTSHKSNVDLLTKLRQVRSNFIGKGHHNTLWPCSHDNTVSPRGLDDFTVEIKFHTFGIFKDPVDFGLISWTYRVLDVDDPKFFVHHGNLHCREEHGALFRGKKRSVNKR